MLRQLRKSVFRRLGGVLVPGAFVLGTSCVENIRESLVSGSLGFVEDAAALILESVVPVEDFIGGGE